MTLAASGPISLAGTTAGQSIELELSGNGTTQVSLNDSALRTLSGIGSGQISFSDFYGKSSVVVSFASSIYDFSDVITTGSMGFYVRNDRTYGTNLSGNTNLGNWLTGATDYSNYEIFATIISGTVQVGSDATGSWLNLGTTRAWGKNNNYVTIQLDIRRVGGGILTTTQVTLGHTGGSTGGGFIP